MPTPGLTDGRVSGKKHYGSDCEDLRRWPGDGFFGQKSEVGKPTSVQSEVGIPTSVWCRLGRLEASMPGRWRAREAARQVPSRTLTVPRTLAICAICAISHKATH